MDKNENTFSIIYGQLKAGMPVIIASILEVQGSSPRHVGTKMIIVTNGKIYGTIGGSLLEAAVIEEAQRLLQKQKSKCMIFELNGEDTASKDMICGGKVLILLDYVFPDSSNLDFFKLCYEEFIKGRDYFLVTQFQNTKPDIMIIGRSIFYPDGKTCGKINLSQGEINVLISDLNNNTDYLIKNIKDTQIVIDAIRKLKTVYLFGAGHVALPTARIAVMAGFKVVVIDDRSEYANAERFPGAAEIRVIESYNQVFSQLPIDSDSFIVILTRGHQYDREVLEQALRTSVGYIGMISSRKKRDAVYKTLMEQGVRSQELERVHSPIGIAIKAETPEEIAVSIVGELISVKNKGK